MGFCDDGWRPGYVGILTGIDPEVFRPVPGWFRTGCAIAVHRRSLIDPTAISDHWDLTLAMSGLRVGGWFPERQMAQGAAQEIDEAIPDWLLVIDGEKNIAVRRWVDEVCARWGAPAQRFPIRATRENTRRKLLGAVERI